MLHTDSGASKVCNMTTATSPAPATTTLVDVPVGTLVIYQYPLDGQLVTVVGRRSDRNVNPGYNAGIHLVDESGDTVAIVSRYAHVQVVTA